MARTDTLGNFLTDVATAIRNKKGTTDTIVASNFDTEIESIESGGDTSIEDGLITRTLTEYSNNRVTEVGEYAFYHSTTLQSIDLPNVTSINGYTFQNCTSLQSIDLSKIININGDGIFDGCSSLKYINLQSCKSIKGHNIFYNCTSLQSIDFPSLTAINSGTTDIFKNTSLTAIILRSETMCTLNSAYAFRDSPIANGTGYIYVPSALIDSYKTATNWSTYANQFRAIEDYPDICGEATS